MTVLLVALGAAVGAPLRYLTDRAVQARLGSAFPWGTLTVNVVGSLVLGVVAGLPATAAVGALVGTGFCGALTTWSTLSYETLRLARAGRRPAALANVTASVAAGLAAATAGYALARAFTG
ncbi:fluoride efflux transporter CrcB [Micromonospora sp. LZ34]